VATLEALHASPNIFLDDVWQQRHDKEDEAMALDEHPMPLTPEEAEALTALCQNIGLRESDVFHEVIRAGLAAYRLELALQLYHPTPQITGDIAERLGINRGDLLRQIYTRGIAPYADPTLDRSARLHELDQHRKQRHGE